MRANNAQWDWRRFVGMANQGSIASHDWSLLLLSSLTGRHRRALQILFRREMPNIQMFSKILRIALVTASASPVASAFLSCRWVGSMVIWMVRIVLVAGDGTTCLWGSL